MQDEVGLARLVQRRGERVDDLVGQLADEADGVGQQVRAAVDAQLARRRVERVEEAVADADLGAGQAVEQRRLAGVRVAGERDLRQVRALALGAHRRARGASRPSSRRRSAVMRLRARRRSVSICDSPGPRAPMPGCAALAPRRSRCVHSPRMRAMLYSSCASSTCSLPSALCACPAKMSRITRRAVDDRHAEPLLEVALLARAQLVVADDDVRVGELRGLLDLDELAGPEVRVRMRLLEVLDDLPDDRDAGRAQQLVQLGEVVAGLERGDAERPLLRAPRRLLVVAAMLAGAAVARSLHPIQSSRRSRHVPRSPGRPIARPR